MDLDVDSYFAQWRVVWRVERIEIVGRDLCSPTPKLTDCINFMVELILPVAAEKSIVEEQANLSNHKMACYDQTAEKIIGSIRSQL